jgi:hypothetical protein
MDSTVWRIADWSARISNPSLSSWGAGRGLKSLCENTALRFCGAAEGHGFIRALEFGHLRGPKGRANTALGNAQGERPPGRTEPCAGPHPRAPEDPVKVDLAKRPSRSLHLRWSALSGLEVPKTPPHFKPRPLAWATVDRPFGPLPCPNYSCQA